MDINIMEQSFASILASFQQEKKKPKKEESKKENSFTALTTAQVLALRNAVR
jgi:predicted DNA binding protein